MQVTFDDLQATFWSLTYIIVIIYSFRYKRIGIPIFAITSNFAWETVALFRNVIADKPVNSIHVAWFSLDVIIVLIYLFRCNYLYFKKRFFIMIFVIELFSFSLIFTLHNGMLLLCFIIDFAMAAEWFAYAFNRLYIANGLSIASCFTKLLGDMFAWLYYRQYHVAVDIIGILVLLINFGCLCVVIKRTTDKCKKT